MEEYARGGGREVEKMIMEEFGFLMYNGGKGMIINKTEYLRWKYRNVPTDKVNHNLSFYRAI